MSLNRALVEFYIHYKLSQRECSPEHLRIGEPTAGTRAAETAGTRAAGTRAAETAGTRAAETAGTRAAGTRAAETAGTRAAETAGDRTEVESSLTQRTEASRTDDGASPDSRWNGSVNGGGSDSVPVPDFDLDAVKEALRDSANEFELRFSRAFSDLHRQLHITPATAYHSFESVMDEVFRDGVNWGRVVGLFAFGGALCVECVDKEMSPLVGRIVDWMTVYLDDHIQDWIDSQGGWSRFADLYGDDAAAQSRLSQESFRKWLLAGITLATGVVVGSLLAHKRL